MIRKFEEIINLADDITLNKAFFQIKDDNEITVYGDINILDYSLDNIKLKVSDITCSISGKNLSIVCIDKSSVVVKGTIENINFTRLIRC